MFLTWQVKDSACLVRHFTALIYGIMLSSLGFLDASMTHFVRRCVTLCHVMTSYHIHSPFYVCCFLGVFFDESMWWSTVKIAFWNIHPFHLSNYTQLQITWKKAWCGVSCCEYIRCCMLTGESCWCRVFWWRVLLANETSSLLCAELSSRSCLPEWPLLTAGPTLARKCHAAVHAITGASPYAWCCKLDIQQSVLLTWQVKGRAAVVRVSNMITVLAFMLLALGWFGASVSHYVTSLQILFLFQTFEYVWYVLISKLFFGFFGSMWWSMVKIALWNINHFIPFPPP